MRFLIFSHSLVSDWNHGNAHFLRGISTELVKRGHTVRILEPADGWSRRNLIEEKGEEAIRRFEAAYPFLKSELYEESSLDLSQILRQVDVAIVHEWNSHALVAQVGAHRQRNAHFRLYFHDTHHRSVTDPDAMSAYDLQHYDGVLAYGDVIRRLYESRGWAKQAWTWHEAADISVFYPREQVTLQGDLVWIGNWGDDERAEELKEFLINPVRQLGLKAKVFGVRYPDAALSALASAGIEYGGWLPNYLAPETFANYRVTIHVPRRPYARVLPGIPTIRPFEALACGIPLVSAPWSDSENLFREGGDFLRAQDGDEMVRQIDRVLSNDSAAGALSASGLETIRSRHTCAHRVDELFRIMARHEESVGAGAT